MLQASIVVPCYNEELRMKPFMDELLRRGKENWEFIFVNDGSKDNTLRILKSYNFRNKKVISYAKNRGKGYAVKSGILEAKGDYIIFIDVDGSIHPSHIKEMLKYLKRYDVVVGNRSLKESRVISPFFRKFTGVVFNILTRILFGLKIKDCLCGFKGFKKRAARKLFGSLISQRWVFDVEIYYKIKKSSYSVYELPIKWEHRDKSKMTLSEIIKVALELLSLRLKLMKIKMKKNS